MRKKKIIWTIIIILSFYTVWSQTYSYDVDDAVEHLDNNALSRSHTCCAWFVMRAMQNGGCPVGILPAWAYRYALPFYGFHRIHSGNGNALDNYTPKRGDIVVFEHTGKHFWGHIAMYDGHKWVSDFKQKNMNPYRDSPHYRIYRRN